MERTLTVLVVETQEECREILAKLTQKHIKGCSVFSVTNEDEALSVLQAIRVDIMVCDAFLSKQKKVDFIHKVCTAKVPPIALIVITGLSELHAEDIHEEICVKKLLYRPVSFADLAIALGEAVDHVQARRVS